MIALAKSTKGSAQAIDYIFNDKGMAIELDRNLISGHNGKEILKEMRTVQSLNHHCVNNTISLVISPSPKDKERLSIKELKLIAHDHLKNLDLINNQWVCTIHPSTGKPHIHIIANRINKNGKALNDSYLGKRAQRSANEIAQKYNYVSARDIMKDRIELKKVLEKPIKEEIKLAHFEVVNSRPKNLTDYENRMLKFSIKIEWVHNNKGVLQGMKFVHLGSNQIFKASDIHKSIRVNKILYQAKKQIKK